MTTDQDTGHENLLERLLRHLLSGDDLDEPCDEARPARAAGQHRRAGARAEGHRPTATPLSWPLNRGVLIRLSDGSELHLGIVTSRRPDRPVRFRTAAGTSG